MAEQENMTLLGCGTDAHGTDASLTTKPAPTAQDDCLLLFCEEGQIICRFDKTGYIAKRGDVICFLPNQKRDFRFGKYHKVAWLRVCAEAQDTLQSIFCDSCVRAFGDELKKLSELLLQLQLEYHAKLEGWQACSDAYLTLIFTRLRRLSTPQTQVMPHPDLAKILPALSAMEQELHADESVEYYAKLCNLSTYHFIRAFHRYAGQTPHRYLIRLRMSRACELLETEMQISEIARAVGYSDPVHFSKQFKQIVGQTPRDYRKEH